MNRFSHVDLAAPLFPPPQGGERGGTFMPIIAGARCATPPAPPAPPFPPPQGGEGEQQSDYR